MDTVVATTEAPVTETVESARTVQAPEIEQDLLVEDVSIDGMCGVY